MPPRPMPSASVVVPSLNQGRFLEATLKSVLEQQKMNAQVLVLDGASTDETLAIISKYRRHLAFWRSYPDDGQAAAINEGFARATGDVLCWLNSDDLHLPHTLRTVAEFLRGRANDAIVLYGGCEVFRDGTGWREVRPAVPFDARRLQVTDFIDQPSAFWTRKTWELVGPLDQSLKYAFDWDWFLRAAAAGVKFEPVPVVLSHYRIHASHKSGTGGERRWRELLEVVGRHSPPEVVSHYEWLGSRPVARWWLNKRMRLAQGFGRLIGPAIAGVVADACAPPFWLITRPLRREIFWEISGIR